MSAKSIIVFQLTDVSYIVFLGVPATEDGEPQGTTDNVAFRIPSDFRTFSLSHCNFNGNVHFNFKATQGNVKD